MSIFSPYLILSSKFGVGFSEEVYLDCFTLDEKPDTREYFTIPHNITLNWGAGNHFFEFGMGGTVILMVSNDNYILYPIIGYRFQPLTSNNINFKVFLEYPIIGYNDNNMHYFSLYGLSIGFSF